MGTAAHHICPHCQGTGLLERFSLSDAEIAAAADGLRHAIAAIGGFITLDGRTDDRGAALAIGLKPKTLANWRSEGGRLPWVKRRGRVLYAFADLARFIAESDRQGGK